MSKTGCMCIDFRTVANRLTRLYDSAMAPSGMTVTQFSQLNAIQTLDGPTLNELAEEIALDRSTLGRNVRVLEKLGFVSLSPGADARTRVIRVTRAGQAAFKRAIPLWKSVQTGLLESLGPENQTQLDELLTNVNDICGAEAERQERITL